MGISVRNFLRVIAAAVIEDTVAIKKNNENIISSVIVLKSWIELNRNIFAYAKDKYQFSIQK